MLLKIYINIYKIYVYKYNIGAILGQEQSPWRPGGWSDSDAQPVSSWRSLGRDIVSTGFSEYLFLTLTYIDSKLAVPGYQVYIVLLSFKGGPFYQSLKVHLDPLKVRDWEKEPFEWIAVNESLKLQF